MLRSNLRLLARYTLGHSLHTLVGPLFSIVLVPLYSRAVGTALYGLIELIVSTGSIIYSLSLLGMQFVLTALYSESDDPLVQGQNVAGVLRVGVYWSLVVLVAVGLLARPIAALLNHPEFEWMIRVSALGQLMYVIYTIQLTLLRLKLQIMRANILSIVFVVANFVSIVLLVVVLGWGIWGVIWANLLTNTVLAITSLALAAEGLRMRPRPGQLRAIAWSGALFLPSSLAVWALIYEDRVFLTHYVTDDQLSLYSLASRLASLLVVFVTPFIAAWTPFALKIRHEEGARQTYSRVLTYSMVLALGAALGLSLFSSEIVRLFSTPEFAPAYRYIWLLAPIAVVSVWNAVVSIGFYITQQIKYIAYSLILAAVVNTILNIMLIPSLGIYGACLATLIAYFCGAAATAFFAQRVYPVSYRWWRPLWALICYLGLAGLGASIENTLTLRSLALRASLGLLFVVLMLLGGVLAPEELALLRQGLRQPRKMLHWMLRRQ